MSTFDDIEEAVAAASQAIQFDQQVDPEIVQVLLDVVLRADTVLRAVDDYTADERMIAAHILGES